MAEIVRGTDTCGTRDRAREPLTVRAARARPTAARQVVIDTAVILLLLSTSGVGADCLGMSCDPSVVMDFRFEADDAAIGDEVFTVTDSSPNGYVGNCSPDDLHYQGCPEKALSPYVDGDAMTSRGADGIKSMHFHAQPQGTSAEASFSFTMRACGSLDRPVPGSHTKPKLFVQNDKSDVRYTMKGLVADDGSANYYFMEGRFDPDKNYNNRQSVTTPDPISYGEDHCWYYVHDDASRLSILYMDSQTTCGIPGTICEVARASTGNFVPQIDDDFVTSMMNYYSTTQSGSDDPWDGSGSMFLLADRAWTFAEIQLDYDAIVGSSFAVASDKTTYNQGASLQLTVSNGDPNRLFLLEFQDADIGGNIWSRVLIDRLDGAGSYLMTYTIAGVSGNFSLRAQTRMGGALVISNEITIAILP